MHSDKIPAYHLELEKKSASIRLPAGVQWLMPYALQETQEVMKQFYSKFYGDQRARTLIFGINPGRFGAGITGVPFTDPVRLMEECGIENSFDKKKELSAEFIYIMIHAFGGLNLFYAHYYISSLCPLGFVKAGVNYNYYDDKKLAAKVKSFITENVFNQIQLVNGNKEVAFCLGEGKNYTFFAKLNQEHRFFDKVIPLPHPRWIMQYRRKHMQEFVSLYLERLSQSSINSTSPFK